MTLESLGASVRALSSRPAALLLAAGLADTLAFTRAQPGLLAGAGFVLALYLLYRVWRSGCRLSWAVLLVQAGITIALVVHVATAARTGPGAPAFIVTQSFAVLVTLGALMSTPVRTLLQPIRWFRTRSDTRQDELL